MNGERIQSQSNQICILAFIFAARAAPMDSTSIEKEDLIEHDDEKLNNEFQYLTAEQLAELDEFLSRKLDDETFATSSSEILHRNTRRPHVQTIVKRDALWTTTEVLECVRRLKHYKNGSKLDLTTEMLNCYRRLKNRG